MDLDKQKKCLKVVFKRNKAAQAIEKWFSVLFILVAAFGIFQSAS